jgi:hypothetical protein
VKTGWEAAEHREEQGEREHQHLGDTEDLDVPNELAQDQWERFLEFLAVEERLLQLGPTRRPQDDDRQEAEEDDRARDRDPHVALARVAAEDPWPSASAAGR